LEEQELAAEAEEQHITAQQCKINVRQSEILGQLQKLCMQKHLLKAQEKQLFNKELNKIEELEWLEGEHTKSSVHTTSVSLSMDLAAMSSESFNQFLTSFPDPLDAILPEAVGSS
jgi:hypothetical protein